MLNNDIMKDKGAYVSPEIIEKVIKASEKNMQHHLLLSFLWKTGNRVSEILELKFKDIHEDLGKISFPILKKRQVKGEAPRMLKDVPTSLIEDVNKWRMFRETYLIEQIHRYREDAYIFREFTRTDERNKHFTRSGVYRMVRRYFGRVGINKVGDGLPHPHLFRHSFAVHFARNSKSPHDLVVLKNYLGHSSINMTMTYLQFTQQDVKETLDRMFKEEK